MKKMIVILMLISVCFSGFLFGKLSKQGTVIDYQGFDSGLKPKEYKEFFDKYKENFQDVVGKDKKLSLGKIRFAFKRKIRPQYFNEFQKLRIGRTLFPEYVSSHFIYLLMWQLYLCHPA